MMKRASAIAAILAILCLIPFGAGAFFKTQVSFNLTKGAITGEVLLRLLLAGKNAGKVSVSLERGRLDIHPVTGDILLKAKAGAFRRGVELTELSARLMNATAPGIPSLPPVRVELGKGRASLSPDGFTASEVDVEVQGLFKGTLDLDSGLGGKTVARLKGEITDPAALGRLAGTDAITGTAAIPMDLHMVQDQNETRLECGVNGLAPVVIIIKSVGRNIEAQGKGLAVAALIDLSRKLGFSPPQGMAEGTVDLRATLNESQVKASVQLNQGSFVSDDDMYMAQALEARATVNGTMGGRLSCSLNMDKGEALADAIYVDFSAHPLTVLASSEDLSRTNATIAWKGLLDARVHAVLGYETSGTMNATGLKLGALYDTFAAPLISETPPEGGPLSIDGTGRIDLAASPGTHGLSLRGRIILEGVDVFQEKRSWVKGARMDMPVEYVLGASTVRQRLPEHEDWGVLDIGVIKTKYATADLSLMPVALVANGLYIGRTIRVDTLGGEISLQDAAVLDPLSESMRAFVEVDLKDLDLSRAPTGQLRISGTLEGHFNPVRITTEMATLEGFANGTVYGGKVKITDIFADKPFAHDRTLGLSAALRGLDLDRASAALGIGRITGSMDADLANLRMAYGQPVAFMLKAWTVEAPDSDQDVSLKAVDSISRLGTGQGLAGLGVGVFASFFRTFPYSAMGFSCSLKNDVFRIKGLIESDGIEYIIKRPPLMGINVVNSNPNNLIRFSDMTDRLSRVLHRAESNQ